MSKVYFLIFRLKQHAAATNSVKYTKNRSREFDCCGWTDDLQDTGGLGVAEDPNEICKQIKPKCSLPVPKMFFAFNQKFPVPIPIRVNLNQDPERNTHFMSNAVI